MSREKEALIRLLSQVVTIVTLPVLVGMGGWAILRVVDHENRLAVIESNLAKGDRYTLQDADRDFGVFANIIEDMSDDLDDHETRLRSGKL